MALVGMVSGCGQPAEAASEDEIAARYAVSEVAQIDVEEPLEFTPTNYSFTGPTPIRQVLDLIAEEEFVWFGTEPSSPYPVTGDCDFDRDDTQSVVRIDELPMTIEGIVTLHPRQFLRASICGQDERNYGAFMLQDSSGGILILKDSRVADFSYGQRIRLRVRGLIKFFDTHAVLVHDQQEIVDRTRQPLYYIPWTDPWNEMGEIGSETNQIGRVYRIRGEITQEPTNANFNEARMRSLTDDGVQWTVSLDRELALRGRGFKLGQRFELTGPVLNSFGLRMVITRLGQITALE